MFSSGLFGQSLTLTLASGSGAPGSTVPLNLSLSGTAVAGLPASLQFTLSYNPVDFSSINVVAGTVATAAGKSISCSGSTCMLWGLNATTMADGQVAVVNATLNATSNPAAAISVGSLVAASPTGASMAITGIGGSIQVIASLPPPQLSTLVCNPMTITGAGSTTCTATLTGAASSGGTIVTLQRNNTTLTIPASVTVAAGANSATFPATATAVGSTTSVSITATAGVSVSTSVTLQPPPPQLSTLVCNPTTITGAGNTSCTATLTAAAPSGGVIVTLQSNNTALTVPASLTVLAGTSSATFSGTASSVATQTGVQITATTGTTKSVSITLKPVTVNISSVSCTPNAVVAGSGSSCKVTLRSSAPTGGVSIGIASSSSVVTAPSTVLVLGGSTTATFNAGSNAVSARTAATITASGGTSQSNTTLTVNPNVSFTSFVCTPTSVRPGQSTLCQLTTNLPLSVDSAIALSDSSRYVSVPSSVTLRAGQSAISFSATVQKSARSGSAVITAVLFSSSAQTAFTVAGSGTASPVVAIPDETPTVLEGDGISFSISATDTMDLPTVLSAANLPAGARFDASTGEFHWEHTVPGKYSVSFTATNSLGLSQSSTVPLEVFSRKPALHRLLHGAKRTVQKTCAAGAYTTIQGLGLGKSPNAGELTLTIDGDLVQIVHSSPREISFVCPDSASGTVFHIQAHRGLYDSNTLQIETMDSDPGLFSFNGAGTGQGLARNESGQFVMIRSAAVASQPALRRDIISIFATGLDSEVLERPDKVQVLVGDLTTGARSVSVVAAGIMRITVQIPDSAPFDLALPVRLSVASASGLLDSNTVTIAVEDGGSPVGSKVPELLRR